MRALVLAGGSGTRLRPITHTSAKQLVPLANKPILFYGLEAIAAAGIREVGMVVGDTAAEIEAAVGTGERWGLQVTYLRQDAPRGLAHGVLIARDFLGDEPFVMYLGDNLLVGGIAPYVDDFAAGTADAAVLLAKVAQPQNFGVAELAADGSLVRLVEKPAEPPSDLALVGVYLFGPAVHDAVRAIEPSWRNELEITDAIQWLLTHGHVVRPHVVSGPWIDTGKLQDLLEANRIVLESIERDVQGDVDGASRVDGKVVVEAGARIVASRVRGPVVIGAGVVIERSYVGPFTSIAAGSRIVDSEVEHSVLLERCVVDGVRRIEDSLLGHDTRVVRSDTQPRAYRLVIGDHSDVQVV